MGRTFGHVLQERVTRALALLAIGACASGVAVCTAKAQPAEWVHSLEADHSAALKGSRKLAAGGAPATSALIAAWPSLSPKARRRACDPLAKLVRADERAAELLATAAIDRDAMVRERAVDALASAGSVGIATLGSLAALVETGDEAARVLSRRFPREAIPALLAALEAPGGADRPELRRALRTAVDRAEPASHKALDAWIDAGPSPAAAAACALALTDDGVHAERTQRLVEIADESTEFSTRWRLLQSVTSASASDEMHAWLEGVAANDDTWMLRAAAIDALGERGQFETLDEALEDPYPRVRAAAARALEGNPRALIPLAELARKDPWHLVRAAALRGLAGQPKAVPIFMAAIDDPASTVRATAIDLLASDYGDVDAWDRVRTRLVEDTWPEVKSAAIRYAGARCVDEAVDSLTQFTVRAVGAGASVYDAELGAEALKALGVIGTESARSVLERFASSANAPTSLRLTAERALKAGSQCR